MTDGFELRLDPTSSRYAADDERWQRQVSDFARSLIDEAPGARLVPIPNDPAAGRTKGALDSIVVPLVSAGALTATVEFIKAWLGRDNGRGVRMTFTDAGGLQEVELSGGGVTDDVLKDVSTALHARLTPPTPP